GYSASQVVDETFLYTLSNTKIQQAYIDDYLSMLNRDIRDIDQMYQSVERRIEKIEYRSASDRQLLLELRTVSHDLKRLYNELRFLSGVLTHQRPYIVLFECESDMWGRYQQELAILADYHSACHECKKALKEIVYLKYPQSKYPFTRYV